MKLSNLYQIIQNRKENPSPASYTSGLFNAGQDEICKKVGEEAIEVIIAAKGQGKQRLIEEVSDLAYHILVLLALNEISLDDIEEELEKRHK